MDISPATAVIAVIGLLIWYISANPKAQETGKIMFLCGLMAFCFALSGHPIHLFH